MPRRRLPFFALAAASLLAFSACGRKAAAPALPDPARIPDIAGWQQVGGLRPSFAGPHRGAFQRTWLNGTASGALGANAFQPWPDGTQLVKEALTPDGKRLGWFWMSKELGRWVWGQAGVEGRVTWRQAGLDNACAACHLKNAPQFDGAFAPVWAGKGRLNIGAGSAP
ncbi:MAG TPA: hypothetical protein VL181_00045 [Holophagaceae bacterium]|nr:hypothetical protein [Holophagaceae bacterium]